jgi:serine/threonine protein kinase
VRDEYIAEVVLADPAGAVPWLATAYVPGISVEDAVRRYGPMPADSVRVLGFCVARAVAAIHAVGLVHRDLKPGNVLLTAQGPKVIDFGIARGVGEEGLTKTGMVAGSPPYMAPEQLVTGEFGPASDVFSLGSILHYAATAAGPYGRGGTQELYARALGAGPAGGDRADHRPRPRPRADRQAVRRRTRRAARGGAG